MKKRAGKAGLILCLALAMSQMTIVSFAALDSETGKYVFDAPESAYWGVDEEGIAHWDKVDKAKRYEVDLFEGDTMIKRVYTGGTRVDLNEYFVNDNVYHFAVRAVPTDSQYTCTEGDWTFSDEIYVDWIGITNGRWRTYVSGLKYQQEDNTYLTDGWKKIGSDWYYFDPDGWAKTGWFNWSGQTYYMDAKTAMMLTGWQEIDGSWYYFNPSGAMLVSQWVESVPGDLYYVGADGRMLVNTTVDGYYVNESGLRVG